MTKEQAREAAAVMLAWADGKEVEYSCRGHSNWKPNESPCWSWSGCDYRIKPTLRPWTADEVPLGAWMRSKGLYGRQIITHTAEQKDREWWLKASEHSIDNGKTWLPCGVVE